MGEQIVPTDEPRWHASIAVVAVVLLYITLPPKFTFGPLWLFPVLVFAVLIPLSIVSPMRHRETALQRAASITLIALSNLFNVISLLLLLASLVAPHRPKLASGEELFLAGVQIWITNILVFALWYWELDGDGPEARAHVRSAAASKSADFLFPQMSPDESHLPSIDEAWKPQFVDYLFLAFSTATALSAADTFPISRMAKMLMMAESLVSLATIAVIVSRAINILA